MCFGNFQTASTDVGFANLSDDVMVIGNNVYRSDLGGVVPAASNVSLSLHAMRKAKQGGLLICIQQRFVWSNKVDFC